MAEDGIKYKVSVIVPVYGAEKYIERCAGSLFGQTLDGIEYIFVNDCTPDRSVQVLQDVLADYPQRKDAFTVVNLPKNMGSAIARTTGLCHCHGEYVIQCDSDDWLEADAYEAMYNKAIETDADVVVCDFHSTDRQTGTTTPMTHPADRLQWISDMLYGRTSWSLWNKLFKASLFDNPITYPTQSMGEDSAIVLQTAYFCQRITYIDRPLYNYYVNPASMVNTRTEDARYRKFAEAMDNCRIIEGFYKDKPEYARLAGGLNFLLYFTKSMLLPISGNPKYKEIWRQTLPGIEWKVAVDRHNPASERLKASLAATGIYPQLTNRLGLTKCR